MPKRIAFVIGSIIAFLILIWILNWAQSLAINDRILNINRDIAIGILGSIAASCAFYCIIESFIHFSDTAGRTHLMRLMRFEETYGISDVIPNKSGKDAIDLYTSSIKDAQVRVWAMGISNNQFIDQHLKNIQARKLLKPTLDVKILFFDPESTVSNGRIKKGTPLINLFDFPEKIYSSNKRPFNVRDHSEKVKQDPSLASAYFVTLPSYFSMLVIDDRVFFFPFLAIAEDAASNPIIVLNAQKNLGSKLVKHFEKLASNALLCHKVS